MLIIVVLVSFIVHNYCFADKVILGSYDGILHIYYPMNEASGLHDCLLETNLQLPILQLKVGQFVP